MLEILISDLQEIVSSPRLLLANGVSVLAAMCMIAACIVSKRRTVFVLQGVQCALLDLLDAHRLIGLSATDSCILTPRKSVTAILGLSDSPVSAHKRSCVLCPNTDNCQLRKSGGHCGI